MTQATMECHCLEHRHTYTAPHTQHSHLTLILHYSDLASDPLISVSLKKLSTMDKYSNN